MRRIWKGYAAWCRKRGATAQCSPALVFLACLIGAAAVIYVYREVILQTLIAAGIVIGIVCGVSILVAFTVNFLRWSKRQQVKRVDAYIAANPLTADGEPVTAPVTDAETEAISKDADWLAGEGVELAWSPDGKTLKAKDDKVKGS